MDLDESIFVSINQSPFVDKCNLLYTIKSTSARIKGVYFYLNWVVSRWCPGKICKNLYLSSFFSFWGVYKRTTLEICPRPELLCIQHQETKRTPMSHFSRYKLLIFSPRSNAASYSYTGAPLSSLSGYTVQYKNTHSSSYTILWYILRLLFFILLLNPGAHLFSLSI